MNTTCCSEDAKGEGKAIAYAIY